MTNTPHIITRDGAQVAGPFPTEDAAFGALLRMVPYSTDHAIRWEGYAIVPAPGARRVTIGRDLPGGVYVEITAEERDGSGTLSAGFSVTGQVWERHGTWSGRSCKRNGRDSDGAGQIVDEIRAAAPELEPVLVAHLADPDGRPMHAEANGWYFYTGESARYERQHYGVEYAAQFGTDHERAARALHVSPAELPAGLDREGFAAFVVSLAPRWAAQSAAARAAIDALTDGDGVEGER